MKNEINVRLFNREYKLLTDETKEHTDVIASALNCRLAEKLKGTSTLSVQDGAALICLECYDELVKTKESVESIRSQIKVYFDEAVSAKSRAEEAEAEAAKLKLRIAQLEKEIEMRKTLTAPTEKVVNAKDMISMDINKALNNTGKYPYNYNKK